MDFAPGIQFRKGTARIAASSCGSDVLETLRTPQGSKEQYPQGCAIFSFLVFSSFVMDLQRLRFVVDFKFQEKGLFKEKQNVCDLTAVMFISCQGASRKC